MAYDLDVSVGIFQSKSTVGKTYSVRLRARDGRRWLACDCPAWIKGREQRGKKEYERECRHTRAMSGWFGMKQFLEGMSETVTVLGNTHRLRQKLSPAELDEIADRQAQARAAAKDTGKAGGVSAVSLDMPVREVSLLDEQNEADRFDLLDLSGLSGDEAQG